MAEDIRISSPIKTTSGSKEEIAFELAKKISDHEDIPYKQKDRKYWLSLYTECLQATSGYYEID